MKKCNNLPKKYEENQHLTDRERLILKLIIEEYINTANPVGSNFLLQNNNQINLSSATIRNTMVQLEKKGLLIKNHTSSGRIPSVNGFKFYEKNLVLYHIPKNLKNQLIEIFKKRNNNIDEVVNDSVKLISDVLELPTIVTSIHHKSIVKKIELVQLKETQALLIVIFSDGNLIKNDINFLKPELITDIGICVQILNDRLINLSIDEITKRIDIIGNLIKTKVQNYEFVIQEVLQRIFNKKLLHSNSHIFSTKNILKQKEFHNFEKLNNVLNLLDNSSMWEYLALKSESEQKTKITFGNELLLENNYSDIAIASTSINLNNFSKKQISIVGPTRMKYGEVIALLEFIKKEIEKND